MGHFVSSIKEREKRDRRGDREERGTGMKGSCGHGTQAIIQTPNSVNERQIRMFRPTGMDHRIKGVIRRPRIVTITW